MDENAWFEDLWPGDLAGLAGEHDHNNEAVTMSRRELDEIKSKVQQQDGIIKELAVFNRYLYDHVGELDSRIANLEFPRQIMDQQVPSSAGNSFLDAQVLTTPEQDTSSFHSHIDINANSPKLSLVGPRYRGHDVRSTKQTLHQSPAGIRKTQRKSLKIEVPENLYKGNPQVGLPTPFTVTETSVPPGAFALLPQTPLTPGRIGPPSGKAKFLTSIHKRGIHNLDKMVPPQNSMLPMVPITDTELIVYFFNALSRPIVSLRLYANGWGPKEICEVLNSHREIDPPYLRNTCSVKCTTAIKKGREYYGEAWEIGNRALFQEAEIDEATDLIRFTDEDAGKALDFNILDMCVGLKSHPSIGIDGGIFTKCVQYCQDHDVQYKLSNVSELAAMLEADDEGTPPSLPGSPDPFQSSIFEQKDADFFLSDGLIPEAASESSDDISSVGGNDSDASWQESG